MNAREELENVELGADLAFGKRQDLGHEQVIPVAFWAGAKGQGGSEFGENKHGEGAGFAGIAVPLGAYVGDEYGTRFRPNIIALLGVLTPLVAVCGWALPRLIKALKK